MRYSDLQLIIRRNLHNKTYTLINISGLAISLTLALLMYSFIIKEVQTDRFHKNGDSIYRILTAESSSDPFSTNTCEPFAPEAQNQIPGIKSYVRMWLTNLSVKTENLENPGMPEHCIHADASFFTMFTFSFTAGAIAPDSGKGWAVISQSAASRYFGNENPIGRTISLQSNSVYQFRNSQDYQIAGVMRDIPEQSTIQADFVLDYAKVAGFSDWLNNSMLYTYVLLDKDRHPGNVESEMGKIYAEKSKNANGAVRLQPLSNIYFNTENVHYTSNVISMPQGSRLFTRMLCGITLLILFLSACNYLMIQIAQGRRNLAACAIQRCFGAGSRTVRLQSLQETLLIFLIAGIIAIFLTAWLFPTFRQVISPQLNYSFPINTGSICTFSFFILAIIFLISHAISQYSIRELNNKGIKGSIQTLKAAFEPKEVLATMQIAIFCALLVCAVVVNRQMDYLKNKDIGYNNHNLLTVNGYGETLKSELRRNPDILAVSTGSHLPEYGNLFFKMDCLFENNQELASEMICGDPDYLDTYQIRLLEGKNFNNNTPPMRTGTIPVLVNQEFVRQAGLQHPVGTLFRPNDPEDDFILQIIGVMDDFNIYALYRSIPPLILAHSAGPSTGLCNTGEITLRYRENKRTEVMNYLKASDIMFYSEYNYDRLYEKEAAFIQLINIFTYIAIFIGGLGVFAFSVFHAENRKKEVALRKINGATEWDIHKLLNRQIIRTTLYACLIGIPLAYYFMTFWLEKFAYRTSPEWWLFPGVTIACLSFVILIIYWQIRKTVILNPLECLQEKQG